MQSIRLGIAEYFNAEKAAETTFGKFDILVNNAALWRCWSPFTDTSVEEWKNLYKRDILHKLQASKLCRKIGFFAPTYKLCQKIAIRRGLWGFYMIKICRRFQGRCKKTDTFLQKLRVDLRRCFG